MAELNSTVVKGKLSVTEDINVNGSIKQNGTSLATVATSGSYNDLSSRPVFSYSNGVLTITTSN